MPAASAVEERQLVSGFAVRLLRAADVLHCTEAGPVWIWPGGLDETGGV